MAIQSFTHDCGCEFTYRDRWYEQTYTCETHGGKSISFGTAARNVSTKSHTVCDVFSPAEIKYLHEILTDQHCHVLLERLQLINIRARAQDDSWTNRLAELDREEVLLREMIRKVLEAMQ